MVGLWTGAAAGADEGEGGAEGEVITLEEDEFSEGGL